jgi:hypothetical protein
MTGECWEHVISLILSIQGGVEQIPEFVQRSRQTCRTAWPYVTSGSSKREPNRFDYRAERLLAYWQSVPRQPTAGSTDCSATVFWNW